MSFVPNISVIIPVKNEGTLIKTTLDSLFSVRTRRDFEVIVVDDASTDGCCDFLQDEPYRKNGQVVLCRTEGIGAANARNLGAEKASGEYFVFCDAHMLFADGWLDLLLEPLEKKLTNATTPAIGSVNNPEFTGYGQTLKFNLRIKWNDKQNRLFETAVLPGACFAVPRKVFTDAGGFERGFKTWGYEDIEFSIKTWLFGYRCHCRPDVKVLHLFRKAQPYEINREEIYYNLMRMAYSHFNNSRIEKCRKIIGRKMAAPIEKEVIRDGVLRQRKQYFKTRKHTDDWYFQKFNIHF